MKIFAFEDTASVRNAFQVIQFKKIWKAKKMAGDK